MTGSAPRSVGSSPAVRAAAPEPVAGWWLVGVSASVGVVVSIAAWFAPAAVARWVPVKDRATWAGPAATIRHWSPVGAAVCLAVVAVAVAGSAAAKRRRGRRAAQTGPGRSWWGQLPVGVRAAAVLVVAAAAAVGVLYLADPDKTSAWARPAGVALGCAAALAAGWWVATAVASGPHRRQWVNPLHAVLAPILQLPAGTRPAQYLRVPARYAEMSGEVVRVQVPVTWSDADAGVKSAIQSAVTSKLGLSDVSFRWHLTGRSSYMTATAAPRPPAVARFADPAVRDAVRAAPESAPVIGLSAGARGVGVDLDAESPHILISAGTGGGKSVMLRTIFAQLLHDGGVGSVLDVKRHSHKWVRGVAGVSYCREIEDLHDELVRLGAEGERRNRIVDDWPGDEADAPVGPRVAILFEEANATLARLKRYWQTVRDPKTDPKESPAIDALREVLFMGRAVRMHVLLVAQSATAAALGGPEMRENFATRILARYTQNAWRMLVPEVSPIPRSTRHVGRAQVVLGGIAHETQVILMTGDEARVWAMSGRSPGAVVSASQRLTGPVDLAKPPVTVATGTDDTDRTVGPSDTDGTAGTAATDDTDRPAAPVGPAPVSLRDAIDSGALSVSLAVARKSSAGRDSEFPEPAGTDPRTGAKLYRPDELIRWERNRPRAGDRSA